MGAGRRTETVNYNGHSTLASGSPNKVAPQRKLAERGRLGSVIFGCTNVTYNECISNKIFGLPYAHHTYVNHIEVGMPLFLFNYTERKLHGIFEAVSEGSLNISPYAWTNGTELSRTPYPAQVRVQMRPDFLRIVSLSESMFKETLIDSYHSPNHFFFEVDVEQTERLVKLFERSAGGSYKPSIPKVPTIAWQTVPPSKVWKKTNSSGDVEDNLKLKKPATVVISEWETGAQYFPSSSKEVIPDEGGDQQQAWSRRHSHADDYFSDESEDLKSPEVTSEADMRRNLTNEKAEVDYKQVKSSTGYRPKLGGYSEAHTSSTTESVLSDRVDSKSMTAAQEEESRRVLERLKVLAIGPKGAQLTQQLQAPQPQIQVPQLQLQGPQVQEKEENVEVIKNTESSDWEKFARDISFQEQALLREEREKLGATLSDLDSSIATTVKNNLELYAKVIEQIREDGIELRRLLDEAKMRLQREENIKEKSHALLTAEIHSLRLELADVRRMSEKSRSHQKSDCGHENGGSQLTALEPSDNSTPLDIYLIGGLGDRLSRLESVMVWSPATDRLRTAAPMLTPRCCAGACVLDGNIYVFGGGDGASWYDTVERYDRREDQWAACAPMKTKRGSLGGVTVGDRIFAVGGGNGLVSFSEVESYDPHLGSWLSCTPMFEKRFCVAATELGGALYAMGGFDGEQYLMSMERFDPREALWTKMPPMSAKRGSLSAAVLHGRIYALGGYDGDGILDVVETFDVRAGRWDMGLQMCCQRAYGAVGVVGDALYYMGGLAQDEAVDSIQRFTEAAGWQSMRPRVIGKRSCLAAVVF